MKLRNLLLFISIVLISFLFRIYGVNWDQGTHLHPDERFLTMVVGAMKMPASWSNYFSPTTSSLNPFNLGFNFFVYGTFPLMLTKLVAIQSQMDTYEGIVIVGRFLSALADTGIVILLFFFVQLFQNQFHFSKWLKYAAAAVYGSTVFAIQQAHFFTVDTFTAFFYFASLFFIALWSRRKMSLLSLLLSGVFFALALASKISALYGIPGLAIFFVLRFLSERSFRSKINSIVAGGVWIGIAYSMLKVANPYYFASPSFFDVTIHPLFKVSIDQLKQLSTADSWFPPAVQWITKIPILFPLQNIMLWGLGIGHALVLIVGLIFFSKAIVSKKYGLLDYVLVGGLTMWGFLFFLYQGTRFGMTMRYFYLLYPFFAILIGYGLLRLLKLSRWVFVVSVLLLAIWPASFMHIYSQDHSRVQASKWIYQNIKPGSVIGTEHWDDALPLGLSGYSNTYQYKELPVFAQDTDDKWKILDESLDAIDYYVLSSNRAYGSILSDRKDYPKMAPFYDRLFSGKAGFKKIAEFTSYPKICVPLTTYCMTANDDASEEAFTVYDHPKVLLFQKIR